MFDVAFCWLVRDREALAEPPGSGPGLDFDDRPATIADFGERAETRPGGRPGRAPAPRTDKQPARPVWRPPRAAPSGRPWRARPRAGICASGWRPRRRRQPACSAPCRAGTRRPQGRSRRGPRRLPRAAPEVAHVVVVDHLHAEGRRARPSVVSSPPILLQSSDVGVRSFGRSSVTCRNWPPAAATNRAFFSCRAIVSASRSRARAMLLLEKQANSIVCWASNAFNACGFSPNCGMTLARSWTP